MLSVHDRKQNAWIAAKADQHQIQTRAQHTRLIDEELQTIMKNIDDAVARNDPSITIKIPYPENLKILRKNYYVSKAYENDPTHVETNMWCICKTKRLGVHVGYTIAWIKVSYNRCF
jgi:hypothetical protein